MFQQAGSVVAGERGACTQSKPLSRRQSGVSANPSGYKEDKIVLNWTTHRDAIVEGGANAVSRKIVFD